MKFSLTDFDEAGKMGELLTWIDNIDAGYVNAVSDEIFLRQPFLLSVLLGYRFDVKEMELEEIIKIYFLIWEYFKVKNQIPVKQITPEYYEAIQNINIQMFKYCEGEHNPKDIMQIYFDDLQKLKSKALLTAVFFRFQNRPVLLSMNTENKKSP